MPRVGGARCDVCGRVDYDTGNRSFVWRVFKLRGWTVERGRVYRCPDCSRAYRRALDNEAADREGAGHASE